MSRSKIVMLISTLVVLISSNACNRTSATAISTVPTNTVVSRPTPSPSSSATPTLGPVESAQIIIVEKCLDVQDSRPIGVASEGVLVLLGNAEINTMIGDAFLLDLETNQLTDISQSNEIFSVYGISVSPDRGTLAYGVEVPSNQSANLILSDNKGRHLKTVSWQNAFPDLLWLGIRGWLSDQQLLLTPSTVLNPYTEATRTYSPTEFPGFSPISDRQNWLSLDPRAERVIYMVEGLRLALVDVSTKRVLATIPEQYDRVPVVAWGPDGSQVAVVGTIPADQAGQTIADEIFILDRDGRESRQMTHLSSIYGDDYNIYNPTWSPDGQKLAFWQNGESLRLFVLDTKTGELTSYCIWGRGGGNVFYGPIWSPDGNQLLVEQQAQDAINSIIIDLGKQVSFRVGKNMIPVGWMR